MAKKRPKRRRRRPAANLEATYICDSCGEEIVVPVDISGGAHQDYVEDCPVCCHPMTLHVDIDPDGEALEVAENLPVVTIRAIPAESTAKSGAIIALAKFK